MKPILFLDQIQSCLETLNGFTNQIPLYDYLVPSEDRNALVVREMGGEAEIMLCLQSSVIERLRTKNFPEDFDLSLIQDLSVAIEELSHFNTYCSNAIHDREISQLELEVQGEVDKFGVALEWLHKKNEADLREAVFDSLFGNFQLGEWVEPGQQERYAEAHQVARNFCRKVLEKKLGVDEQRLIFRSFFSLPKLEKLSTRFR